MNSTEICWEERHWVSHRSGVPNKSAFGCLGNSPALVWSVQSAPWLHSSRAGTLLLERRVRLEFLQVWLHSLQQVCSSSLPTETSLPGGAEGAQTQEEKQNKNLTSPSKLKLTALQGPFLRLHAALQSPFLSCTARSLPKAAHSNSCREKRHPHELAQLLARCVRAPRKWLAESFHSTEVGFGVKQLFDSPLLLDVTPVN